jgi:hypothetical protein
VGRRVLTYDKTLNNFICEMIKPLIQGDVESRLSQMESELERSRPGMLPGIAFKIGLYNSRRDDTVNRRCALLMQRVICILPSALGPEKAEEGGRLLDECRRLGAKQRLRSLSARNIRAIQLQRGILTEKFLDLMPNSRQSPIWSLRELSAVQPDGPSAQRKHRRNNGHR